MARVKNGIINLRGKVDDQVIVERRHQEAFTRKQVAPGTKKNEKALRSQYLRTGPLNKFASALNQIFKGYRSFPRRDIYQHMLSRFREASVDTKIAHLHCLQEMELNPKYPLSRFVLPLMKVEELQEMIRVSLKVTEHAPNKKYKDCNCYCFELLLIQWKGEQPVVSKKLSDWVSLKGPKPLFEFDFPVDQNSKEYILFLRMEYGLNNDSTALQGEMGIRVVKVGSLDPADKQWLEQRILEERKIIALPINTDQSAERVKAKELH